MADTSAVVDASAVLALLKGEAFDKVSPAEIGGAVISAINYSEVLQKLIYMDIPAEIAREMTDDLDLTVAPFDRGLAQTAADLWLKTRAAGLSLADRACIALGMSLKRPILTADRSWAKLNIPRAQVVAIR